MVDISTVFRAMSILFDGVQYKYWSKVADVAVEIVSGTLRLILPTEVVESVTQYLGGYEEQESGFLRVPCYTLQLNELIGFNFSGVELRVPSRDLVFQNDGDCSLSMESSRHAPYFIGGSILRSAYLVVDLESREVAIAQALTSEGDADIEEIVSGIPLAVEAPLYTYTEVAEKIILNTYLRDWEFTDISVALRPSYSTRTDAVAMDQGGTSYVQVVSEKDWETVLNTWVSSTYFLTKYSTSTKVLTLTGYSDEDTTISGTFTTTSTSLIPSSYLVTAEVNRHTTLYMNAPLSKQSSTNGGGAVRYLGFGMLLLA